MTQDPNAVAGTLLTLSREALGEHARQVARHIDERTPIARNIAKEFDQKATLGQRAADAVARFGGSWAFLTIFGATMLVWIALNSLHPDQV